jgi:hypothetical protein
MQANPNTTDMVTPEQPVAVKLVLDSLPGLVGAIDRALLDTAGQKMPFVLMVFAGKDAMHATNIHPPGDAILAIRQLADAWETHDPQPAN